MSTIELREVREKVELAVRAVEADAAASPVLAAVVREFAAKAAKANRADADHEWEAVVEVEQAADSAKVAAEADAGAAETTTSSVLAAHLAICMLKAALAEATK